MEVQSFARRCELNDKLRELKENHPAICPIPRSEVLQGVYVADSHKAQVVPFIYIMGNTSCNLSIKITLIVTCCPVEVHFGNFIQKNEAILSNLVGQGVTICRVMSVKCCGCFRGQIVVPRTLSGSAENHGTPNIGTCLYSPQNMVASRGSRTSQGNWYVVAAPMKVSDGVITSLSHNSEDSSLR